MRYLTFVLTLLAGCTSQVPNPDAKAPDTYPVRDDFLVDAPPPLAPVPSGWYKSGESPLSLLRAPADTFSSDTKLLAAEVGKKIFDTRKLSNENRDALAKVLTELFGTPTAPKVTSSAEAIATLNLTPEVLAQGARVYRQNCIDCHGLTGDGNGPGGKWLVPLPRDYRQGTFKYIRSDNLATRCGPKPRRSDLVRTLRQGMDGASMPSFAVLPIADVDAVLSYVTHLAIRGECEYELGKAASMEEYAPEEIADAVKQSVEPIVKKWLDAEANPIEPGDDPAATEDEFLASASNGYAIFMTSGGCTKCHVDFGRNGTFMYDVWGGVARARNLTLGTLRGGRDSRAIYTRVYLGIAGSGMPALVSNPDEAAAAKGKLWDLAHFVQSVGDPSRRAMLRERYGIVIE